MNTYLIIKTLHVISAFALVGPLALAPGWLYLYRSEDGRRTLGELHKLTGYAGVFVLVFGVALLYVQEWQMLLFWWMRAAVTIFVFILLFDHFWADKQEKKLAQDPAATSGKLKIWLVAKLLLYVLIASLMVLKP